MGAAVYHLVRTGDPRSDLTVNFTTGGDAVRDGHGDGDPDYTLSVGGTTLTGNSVTIPAGQSSLDVTLATLVSKPTIASRTATFRIESGSGYQVGASSGAAIAIVYNEFSLSLSALTAYAIEPSTDSTFRISRTGDTTYALKVNFTITGAAVRYSDAADTSGSDYELQTDPAPSAVGTLVTGNSVTIAPGDSYVDVALVVLDNAAADFPRTATMTLTDGNLLVNTATINIYNCDAPHCQTILPDDLYSVAGGSVSVPVQYTTSTNNSTLSGLGLKMYYDSSFMTFTGFQPSSLLQTSRISVETGQSDSTAFPGCDTYIMVSWLDAAGQWPNQALPVTLFVANFTLNSSATGTSTIHFSGTPDDGAPGDYAFRDATNLETKGTGINVTAIEPNLNVNGDGDCDLPTDGALIMRYLFDPNGAWTTADTIDAGATRTTHDEIKSYLDAASTTMLNVNGNGQCDALTDGMLILQYLSDPGGNWTTDGLIGAGATRTTPAEVKSFLDSYFVGTVSSSSLSSAMASCAGASAMSSDSQTTGSQIVTPSQTSISATPGGDVTFDVNYSTNPSDPALSGLGLRMYYNSSQLTFNGLSNVLANGEITQETPQDDTDDGDGDPSTDKYVLVGWADLSQNWPGAATQRLYTADFTLNSAASAATHVNFGASSPAGWTFASTPVTVTPNTTPPVPAGPTIGSVVFSAAKRVISWNAADSDGVAGSHLQIDGKNVSQVYGPYQAAPGVNYSASTAVLAVGHHSYVITASDKAGHSSTFSGSFDVVAGTNNGPTIGSVVFAAATRVLTFNAVDADGVAACSVKLDNANVSRIYGPYAAAQGVNYAAVVGVVAAGHHTYTITVTDKAGRSSDYSGSFDAVAVTNTGPTISSVVFAAAKKVLTWNALDSDGIASCSVTIDNANVSQIYGPYAAAQGVNYAAVVGALAVGTHAYSITAVDKAGHSSTLSGTLSVAGPQSSAASEAVWAAVAANATASAKADWLYDGSDLLSA